MLNEAMNKKKRGNSSSKLDVDVGFDAAKRADTSHHHVHGQENHSSPLRTSTVVKRLASDESHLFQLQPIRKTSTGKLDTRNTVHRLDALIKTFKEDAEASESRSSSGSSKDRELD